MHAYRYISICIYIYIHTYRHAHRDTHTHSPTQGEQVLAAAEDDHSLALLRHRETYVLTTHLSIIGMIWWTGLAPWEF